VVGTSNMLLTDPGPPAPGAHYGDADATQPFGSTSMMGGQEAQPQSSSYLTRYSSQTPRGLEDVLNSSSSDPAKDELSLSLQSVSLD
jgi:hypothetical protein